MVSPYVEIFEEPAPKLKRFRYESEGRSAPLEGTRTAPKAKSFPSIRIVNYTGKATVVVSCVTADQPYRQHPHTLVGKNCGNGVCYIPEFYTDSADPAILPFPELRIQSCLVSQIPERLEERRRLNINPFDLSDFGEDDLKRDIHKVRLCFQVLISPDAKNPTVRTQFEPIVSQAITNNKAAAELKIHDISDTCSPACGGKKIIIMCNKIAKEDIEVRFYEEDAKEQQTLIGLGCFQPHKVHRDVAIAFTTPKYDLYHVDRPSKVFVEMVRPSDNARSNRIPFQYVADVTDIDLLMLRKQRKVNQSKNLFELLASHTHVPSNNQERKESQQHKLQCNTVQLHSQQRNLPQNLNLPQHHNVAQEQHGLPKQHNLPQLETLPQQQNTRQQRSKQPFTVTQQQHLTQQNLPQDHNSSHQQNLTHQYNFPQHQNNNLSQQHISQEQFNPQHQYDPQPQYNLQIPLNPQQNYYPQQHGREPSNEELLDFGGLPYNPFEVCISPVDYAQEDQLMLSANDNWNSGHNAAGPSPIIWNL